MYKALFNKDSKAWGIYNEALGLWLTEPAEHPAYFGERVILTFDSETDAAERAFCWNTFDELVAYSEELGLYDD